ncbi:basement membrane-specific heparan sulfate proteoglycan core protein isoform X2 [Danio rerio]|uniref:Basement membrane-specific heparan sulfate proteoglycan core protein isoform X2 n=1 Tax=Danio rerio TaxID=7955 RepID=A0AB40EA44_DANRE
MEHFIIVLLTATVYTQVTAQNTNPPLSISKPSISRDPSHTVLYSSETVTLHCQVSNGPPALQYDWYKDSTDLNHHEGSFSAETSGIYECKAKKESSESDKSDTYTLDLQAIPTPTLSKPTYTEVYTSETVSLKCEIQGRTESWTYQWLKSGEKLQETTSQLVIQSAKTDHSGDYKCKGILQGRVETSDSNSVKVNIHAIPTPTLSKPTNKEVYTTEKVSLKCEIQGRTESWTYQWFKGGEKLQETTSKLDIQSAKTDHSGDYKCKGNLQGRVETSDSNSVRVNIHTIPTPTLSKPTYTEVYTSETVSLKCEIPGRTEHWNYQWFKGEEKLQEAKSQLDIRSATKDDSGVYKCKGILQGRVETPESDSVTINIHEPPQPKLSIESEWKSFYQTEKVTLKCSVDGDSNEWSYEWLKDATQLPKDKDDVSLSGKTLTISSAKAIHSGFYTCKGIHQTRKPVTTIESEKLQLQVAGVTPKPDIRKNQWFKPFYTGEEIQLDCSMNGTGWKYSWHNVKESKQMNTNSALTIGSASVSDTSGYLCKAKRGDFSVNSETLDVEVLQPPQPKLSIGSEWKSFYQTEKVTLKCSVDKDSGEWGYEWQYPNEEDISLSGNTLSISSANVNHSGVYSCVRKHLTRKSVTERKSEELKLHINGTTPKLNIIKHQWFKPFYTGEKIQLDCNMTGVGWKYSWYKVTDSKQINTNSLAISSASVSDTSGYLCKAKRGDFSVDSETLEVQVQKRPGPHIQSEWAEAYIGEKMSMQCLNVPSMNELENWSFRWFKGSKEIVSNDGTYIKGNTLTLSVQSSHGGEYECQAKLKDRPVETAKSKTQQLTVHALSVPKLEFTTKLDDIMKGEMTLKCEISDGREWNYTWYENEKMLNFSESETLTVLGTEERIKSEFKCKGVRTERPHFTAESNVLVANNLIFKRQILLAISGCLVCCILILILGCIALKFMRKPVEKKDPTENDLFFKMTDSNNQTATPLKEYMDNTAIEIAECKEIEELLTNGASVTQEGDAIKDEPVDSPAAGTNGLTSFKGI